MIRTLIGLLLLVAPVAAAADDFPDWAYPALPAHVPDPSPELRRVPDSPLAFTQAQIDSGYEVADWYPNEHPPMPQVVARGGAPPLRACAMCHLPSGAGHPESASLAGLPAGYMVEQLEDYIEGRRTGSRAASMTPIARAMTPEDMRAASAYFASLAPVPWVRVQESTVVPQTFLGLGAVRYALPNGATEPLGERIIEIPEDTDRGQKRDSHSGFVTYVPPGSLARGEAWLRVRDGTNLSCSNCHGATLGGEGEVPGLRGRLALPAFRALNDIRLGSRTSAAALTMREVVAEMSQADMIDIAAYLASLPP